MRTRLSIIIPVYNTEKWVGRCLDSCLRQDIPHDEYEIIVVNDGTPDDAMAIVAEYASRYGNIKVFDQENGGASKARNRGIEEARGEYIWFVDSDDYVKENCIKALLERSCDYNLDVLCFDERMVWDNGKKERIPLFFEKSGKVYDGIDFICHVDMPKITWLALYRRDFILSTSLRFIEGIMYEDQDFPMRAYCLSSRISYVDEVIYYYYQREGSLMSRMSSKRRQSAHDLLVVSDSLYDFSLKHLTRGSWAWQKMINNVAFAFCQSLRNYDIGMFELSEYSSKPYYPLEINKYQTRRERMKHRVINMSLRLYLFLYKLFA